jgi:hypothetical protein
MVRPRDPDDDDEDPRKSSGERLLSSKALLLLVIAIGIAVICAHSPRWGAAIGAGITALVLLSRIVH